MILIPFLVFTKTVVSLFPRWFQKQDYTNIFFGLTTRFSQSLSYQFRRFCSFEALGKLKVLQIRIFNTFLLILPRLRRNRVHFNRRLILVKLLPGNDTCLKNETGQFRPLVILPSTIIYGRRTWTTIFYHNYLSKTKTLH
jgi:hypothetical protein